MNLIQDQEDINTHTMAFNFLHNGSWKFPYHITDMIPNLYLFADHVTIPLVSIVDSKVWIHTSSRDLNHKDA